MNILLNDTIIPKEYFAVDIDDRGYQFGDGIYEVARFYGRKLFEWKAHLQRLVRSAKELMISLEIDAEKLYQNVMLLIEESGVSDGSFIFKLPTAQLHGYISFRLRANQFYLRMSAK
jgi:D-alanine transaminase